MKLFEPEYPDDEVVGQLVHATATEPSLKGINATTGRGEMFIPWRRIHALTVGGKLVIAQHGAPEINQEYRFKAGPMYAITGGAP